MSTESQLRRYRQLVETLAALARSSHQVDAVVRTVHQQAGRLIPANVTLLALLKSGGDWRWELFEGEQRLTQHLPYYPEGILEGVLHGEPLSIPDIGAYLDRFPVRTRRLLETEEVILDVRREPGPSDQGTRSMIFVPLEVQGARAGVLSMQSYATHAFDSTDLQFLELLAQHVSIALDNAALREALERATLTDTLTALPNRRAFNHEVAAALDGARRGKRPATLVMLDVHQFKCINDTFGHLVGDVVLSVLGQVFRETLSAPQRVFRLGGDEFALLLWGADEVLDALATSISTGLRGASWPAGVGPVGLQAGAAAATGDMTVQDWLALADARLYRVKRGRTPADSARWGLDFGAGVARGLVTR